VRDLWTPPLKNRYLKDNQSRFGLYLVGWFNCAQWDKGDARKNRCAKIPRNEAQEKFDSQAATLSAKLDVAKATPELNVGAICCKVEYANLHL
jgi:hypothetical protein